MPALNQSPTTKRFFPRLLSAAKASVDAQEFPWLPPWCRGHNERERAVRAVRAAALRLIRQQQGESTLAILWRALAWPALLLIKAWRHARYGPRSGFWQRLTLSCSDLIRYNIRPNALWAVRSQRPDELHLPRLYVPDRENQALLAHLNHGAPNANLGDKLIFEKFCSKHGFPHVPILAHGVSARHTQIASWPAGDLFAKPTNLWGGQGAEILTHSPQTGTWQDRQKNSITSETLLTWAENTYAEQPWLIQPRLHVDPAWAGWSSGALGTIRISTIIRRPGDSPEIFISMIRLPLAGSVVDNIYTGSLSAEIDATSGHLGPARTKRRPRMSYDHHPETGAQITGALVPDWSSLCDLAISAHHTASDLTSVSWDITYQNGRPVLLEANPVFNLFPTVILGETTWLEAMSHRIANLS